MVVEYLSRVNERMPPPPLQHSATLTFICRGRERKVCMMAKLKWVVIFDPVFVLRHLR